MTHERKMLDLDLFSQGTLTAALVYDFIPLDHHGYLNSFAQCYEYKRMLDDLNQYTAFFSISNYTSSRLIELLNISSHRVFTTKVAIDNDFYSINDNPTAVFETLSRFKLNQFEYFICVGGGDTRKNAELVVKSVARTAKKIGKRYKIVIGGHYAPEMRLQLRSSHIEEGGYREDLIFLPRVTNNELASLYSKSIASITASLIEGFSIPVVEAIASGTISIVSDCDAHLELISTKQTIFTKDEIESLCDCLTYCLSLDDQNRTILLNEQRKITHLHRIENIQSTFWTSIDKLILEKKSSSNNNKICLNKRPKVAIATPWPPQMTGIAPYSYNFVKNFSQYADIDVFMPDYTADASPLLGVNLFPFTSSICKLNYDKIFYVVGNSHYHSFIIDELIHSGGTSIVHDSRLFDFYLWRKGGINSEFLSFINSNLSEKFVKSDVELWIQNPRLLPSMFLDDVLAASSEVVVHHPEFADSINNMHSISPIYIPFAVRSLFSDEDLSDSNRRLSRKSLNIPEDVLVISTFGGVHHFKGCFENIYTIKELRSRGLDTELHFVGNVSPDLRDALISHASELKVSNKIFFPGLSTHVNETIYNQYLLATDIAIQTRKILFGQGSGALAECAAAGIPTVSNRSLAYSVESPSYVQTIPDTISVSLLSNKIHELIINERHKTRCTNERDSFVSKHSFSQYATQIFNSFFR